MNGSIPIILIFLTATASGYSFDKERQFDIQYPATLEINNKSRNTIYLNSIYSTADMKGGFVLEGGQIDPKSIFSIKISETVYDAIRDGKFVLEGVCGDVEKWRKDGATLSQNSTENESKWKITISIDDCNM